MRTLAKMTWLELKLFLREPLTVLFAFALPFTILFVMGGVFGNQADPGFYRGVGSMDYYVPAYIALVVASVGLISLPTHLASNRENGVLKRYRASGLPTATVTTSQIVVTLLIGAVSAILLVAVGIPVHDVAPPDSVGKVVLGFVVSGLVFASLGVLLGALLPSSRSAQALGVMLWFVMLMIGGAGPPPEVLTGTLSTIGEWTPLRQTIEIIQDGWLGLDAGSSWLIAVVTILVASLLSLRFFRWE